ncbi:tetratricopeptide repeat protein [Novosphingobium sp.]|jgi:cytochrome c-type biogenesis protein CcmH|uniref:tetratricopeptide repeat protein n=1 Tax=Novosphingobium sp. TaxID=1874826 RepID=UPI002FDF7ED9
MTWIFVALLAILSFAAIVFLFKTPRGGREAVAAALMLGVAGYAAQGRPGEPGAPKPQAEAQNPEAGQFFVEARAKLSGGGIPTGNRWVVISDGLARNGHYSDAAQLLRGAIEDNPKDAEAWVALGNVLVAHAEGVLTPPALYAYRQAAKADPKAPGPPYFLGLAMAQSGQLDQARALWIDLLRKAPEDAEWRLPLAGQLQRLDAFISSQSGQKPEPESAPQPEPESRPKPQVVPSAR